MTRDVSGYLTSQQASNNEEVSQQFVVMEEFYNKKLWHQLTLCLLKFVKDPIFESGDGLLQLYENFLADFENKINPLSLVELVAYIIKQIKNKEDAIDFVEKIKEKVKANKESKILCNTFIGQLYLQLNKLDEVKKITSETEEMLESIDGVTTVHGRFYQLFSDYHQVIGNHAEYYKNALRYLGCIELEDIPDPERVSRAFSLSLAALLGDGVYNFGELLAHGILDSLKGTEHEWLIELLLAFNSGSLQKYEKLRTHWQKQADLAANELKLRQKITLLCLMEMTFVREANKRQLSFQEISNEAQLPINEVELLVMKALSLGLVKGTIDQVDQKVQMTWVQPRVLDKQQISCMLGKLDSWCKDVHTMEMLIEDKAFDILT